MTNASPNGNGATFKRGIWNDTFMEALRQLASQESWWREVLEDPGLIIAVRDEYLNVYWQGQSLFKVSYRGGKVHAETHPKYLLDPSLGTPVPFDGVRFTLPQSPMVHEFKPKTTLRDMKRAAALYAGEEKKGVHTIVRKHPTVLDVEISLRRLDPEEDQSPLPRIDIAAVEHRGNDIYLVFWEAKLFWNKDLRAKKSKQPPVIEQVKDYQDILRCHCSSVLESYRQVAKNLVAITEMRPHGSALDDVIRRIAATPERLKMADPPEVGLLVFDFDADQRDGAAWKPHKEKLERALPNRTRMTGDAKDIRLGNSQMSSQQAESAMRLKLQALARFVPVFTAPGFQFGTWHPPRSETPSVQELPYCVLSSEAKEFVQTAIRLEWVQQFPWTDWKETPEGKALVEDPDRIAGATAEQLAKVLTVYIRGERFNEGLLNAAYEAGVLTAIVRRADALLQGLS